MIWIKKFIFFLSTIPVLIVYVITQAPGVIHIDSGELAAVACLPGIPHPTGYPLFTILGYLFSLIPFFETKIKTLNFLSTLYTVIGFYFISKTNFLILKNLHLTEQHSIKSKKKTGSPVITDEFNLKILAIISAYIIAFSKTFWSQSTSVEVYSLHIALVSIAIYLFLNALLSDEKDKKSDTKIKSNKKWLIFAFFFGLSFTNHMTSILLIPAFVFHYFNNFGFNKISLKKILLMLAIFIIPLILYLYLPLRASANPELNWGNPIDFERFQRHIMGWQYQSWIFSSTESASKQFKYFLKIFPEEFAYLGILLFIIGIIVSFRLKRKLFYFVSILFITCVLYSINYDINDIDSYFLLAFISAGFFITFSFYYFFEKLKNKISYLKFILTLVPLTTLIFNFEKVNQSENSQFQDYTYQALQSLDKNSIVISYLWDFFISPSYYLQFVENHRKDVTVIDKELLRRSWYFNQLKKINPVIYARSENLIKEFIPELLKFERNQNYNSIVLEKYFREIISSFIVRNINDHSIYLTPEMITIDFRQGLFTIPDSLRIVPDLFMFKVVVDTSYHELKVQDYVINFRDRDDYYSSMLKDLISTMHVNRALYELDYNYREKAKKFVELALKINPGLQLPDKLNNLIQTYE